MTTDRLTDQYAALVAVYPELEVPLRKLLTPSAWRVVERKAWRIRETDKHSHSPIFRNP